ncbi:MAG: hypothetical protein FJ404_13240 [Verrucomicrobia bacterium]|nr:hypothetical protein [Verrucomicrobiota bacterium]
MKSLLQNIVRWSACALLAASLTALAGDDKKPNPVGTWKWSMTGQNGQTRESTLKLKMEGDKLVGTISGRQQDSPIEDASLKGDEISFKVVREFNGNKFTIKYLGKISGDSIKGKSEFDRNGEAQTRDWEAKREVEKPKADK